MNKILSVVIPTYNMEKYLKTCLDSFIYDEKAEDLEILIVNDGSKDNSLKIAQEYEAKYPNIFKVIDKENGGHGSTINAGIKVATGKYFKAVDADDWVDTKELVRLLEYLKNNDIDCVLTNFSYFYETSNKFKLITWNEAIPNKVINTNENDMYNFCFHRSTFKTEKIRNVQLQEKCFYVDVEFNLYSYINCDSLIYLPLNLYQYRLGRAGQSVSPEGLYKHRDNHFTVIKNIINFYQTNKDKTSEIKKKNIFDYSASIVQSHYRYHNLMSFWHKEVLTELAEFDKWLQQYPEYYQRAGEYKIAKKFRKNNFKRIFGQKSYYQLKQFVKKILGKA